MTDEQIDTLLENLDDLVGEHSCEDNNLMLSNEETLAELRQAVRDWVEENLGYSTDR